MKKLLVLLSLSLLVVVGCNLQKNEEKETVSPSQVSLNLYNALISGDSKTISENIHFADSVDLKVFTNYLHLAFGSKEYKERTSHYEPSYRAVEEKIEGDQSQVILAGKDPTGAPFRITVHLLKINGDWKVDGNQGVFHE